MEPERRIDHAEVAGTEADEVAILVDLRDADGLASEGAADGYLCAAPLYAALAVDPADFVIGVVPGLLEAYRHGPLGGLPMRRWRRLIQGLVRALLVVMDAERIEPRLLLGSRF